MKFIYPVLLIIWFLAFSAEAGFLSYQSSRLSGLESKLEAVSVSLRDKYKETHNLLKQTRAKSEELEYLMSIPNILPQDRGYLRTQKAIADEIQTLRRQVSRRVGNRTHIVIDTKTNKLFLKSGMTLQWQADCSVGRGGILADKNTGRKWEFVTPRGEFKVLGKLENPVWNKPDWAFVEAGEATPPPEDPRRKAQGELGAYVLNLGHGYLIHGTKNEEMLGRPASHGCVRLGAENLQKLYQAVPVGTKVYIY